MFSGNVPIDLGLNLRQIQSINFQRNMLTNDPSSTGDFLNSFSHCKYLKFLMIGDNQFNGILPKSSLTNMSLSLERFIAFYCGIRGEFPVKIGNWTNLSWLTLGANEFIGSIPQELGNLKKLQTLRLYENKLDGIIPERLCEIKELYYFDLRRNQITGQVLGCFGNISSLRYIYFDSNNLSSSVPLNFWSNKDISVVSLSFNQLNGPLASEIGNMGGLSELYLSRNELFGSISSTIVQLQKLVILALDMNRLERQFVRRETGNHLIIREFDNLKGMLKKEGEEQFPVLEEMWIGGCPVFIFPTLSSVKKLVVHGEKADAIGFRSISNLRALPSLNIICNKEATSLPEEMFKSLANLKYLNISFYYKLKELPTSLASLNALKHLVIIGCQALESLPEEGVKGLTSLTKLSVSYCEMLKCLPEGLQHLKALTNLLVRECPTLAKRCEKGIGQDWYKIAHIPDVFIR